MLQGVRPGSQRGGRLGTQEGAGWCNSPGRQEHPGILPGVGLPDNLPGVGLLDSLLAVGRLDNQPGVGRLDNQPGVGRLGSLQAHLQDSLVGSHMLAGLFDRPVQERPGPPLAEKQDTCRQPCRLLASASVRYTARTTATKL